MSNIPARPQPNLDEIIERAHAELKKAESTPFSEPALEEFRKHAGAYAVELINESVKGAKDIKPKEFHPLTYDTQVNILYLALVIGSTGMQVCLEVCFSEPQCRRSYQQLQPSNTDWMASSLPLHLR
jgi:hypothetical protein